MLATIVENIMQTIVQIVIQTGNLVDKCCLNVYVLRRCWSYTFICNMGNDHSANVVISIWLHFVSH